VAGVTLSGAIMDILAWPATFDPQASILAMDASGNLLYCLPNIEPEGKKLAVPPNMLFGDLLGFTEDLGNLYVLDPSSNAVWIYWGSKVGEEPYLFFDQQVPVMQTVVDLAVNNDELYLLHEDGHMTVCYYNGLEEALTRCTDQQYMDFRPGRENTPLVAPSPFEQVLHAPPPDPSLYLLEPEGRAIYHFSLRTLAFQRQFLPLDINKLPLGRATAFAVDPIRRNFFLAVGDQVFYAMMP